MEIILLEKVTNLGGLGDIVKVKDGYARNFLIPSGRARRATAANKAEFEARRAELEKQAAEKLAAAQQQGEKLAGATIKLTQKAGVDGRLFGSVTNYDIAEELKKQHGVEVHKSQIRLPSGPIKTVGDSTVVIALHTDVLAEITVAVYGETVVPKPLGHAWRLFSLSLGSLFMIWPGEAKARIGMGGKAQTGLAPRRGFATPQSARIRAFAPADSS